MIAVCPESDERPAAQNAIEPALGLHRNKSLALEFTDARWSVSIAGRGTSMNLKSAIRPLVPPILYEAASRLKNSSRGTAWRPGDASDSARPNNLPLSYKPRKSFALAAREAGPGYNDQRLRNSFHDSPVDLGQGVPAFTAPLFASVAAASMRAQGAVIKIVDFGGASGYLRSCVNTFFGDRIKSDWTIVETADQVNFVGDLGRDDVRYSATIGAGHYDLAIFSSSLQYVEDWKTPLRSADADMIYIARTPLGDHEQPFLQSTLRDGIAVQYPGRIVARKDLFAVLEPTHRLMSLWELDAHLFEMGVYDAPAMLWERRTS
jgi:putative methyltransferase (TIGR04325 family)